MVLFYAIFSSKVDFLGRLGDGAERNRDLVSPMESPSLATVRERVCFVKFSNKPPKIYPRLLYLYGITESPITRKLLNTYWLQTAMACIHLRLISGGSNAYCCSCRSQPHILLPIVPSYPWTATYLRMLTSAVWYFWYLPFSRNQLLLWSIRPVR